MYAIRFADANLIIDIKIKMFVQIKELRSEVLPPIYNLKYTLFYDNT